MLAVGRDAFLGHALELVHVPKLCRSSSAASVFPRRDPIRLARGRTERENGSPGLLCACLPELTRDGEDACTRRRVEPLVVDGERRTAAEHDVQLLVHACSPARLPPLGMPRHDGLAGIGAVGTDAERVDSELGAQRQPVDPLGSTGPDLVEVYDLQGARR